MICQFKNTLGVPFFILFLILSILPSGASGAVSLLPSSAFDLSPRFFNNSEHVVLIHGEIRPGDYDRFVASLRAWRSSHPEGLHIPSVVLASPGGDVREAMRIGRTVRELSLQVLVPSRVPFRDGDPESRVEGWPTPENFCHSSCFLIYIAGVDRKSQALLTMRESTFEEVFAAPTPIGIHRPYFNPTFFAGLDSAEARVAYGKMEAEVRDYLRYMGLSERWVETVFRIPSTTVRRLTWDDVREIGERESSWDEWLRATCDGFSDLLTVFIENREAERCIVRTVAQERVRLVEGFLETER